MSARKEIQRPSVTDLAAGLSARFVDTHASDTQHTDVTPESHAKTTPVPPASHARPAPAGMVRRSLYTSASAFKALDEAAAHVQRMTGAMVPKHEIIARILLAGAEQADAVRRQLVKELADRLQAE